MQANLWGYNMASRAQVKAFIDKIAPIAQAKSKGRILPSVCIAQACCESAYGTSQKMVNANAIFGIKVGKSKTKYGTAWKGKVYNTKTKECYDGKNYVNITDLFRAYDSIDDSIEDYFDMLGSLTRYKAAIGEKDAHKCITAIKNGGYATSPTYITTIMSIINKYSLTQYDTTKRSTLRQCSAGDEVKEMQTLLIKAGYSCGKYGADGMFGLSTLEAVKAFQADRNLTVDGVVGAKTWEELLKS